MHKVRGIRRKVLNSKNIVDLRETLPSILALLPKNCSSIASEPPGEYLRKHYFSICQCVAQKFLAEEYYHVLSQSEKIQVEKIFVDQWYPFTSINVLLNCVDPENSNEIIEQMIKKCVYSKNLPKCIVFELHNNFSGFRVLVTLPDKISKEILKPRKYFHSIIHTGVNAVVDFQRRDRKIFLRFITQFFSLICSRGFADIAAGEFLKILKNWGVENGAKVFGRNLLSEFPPGKSFVRFVLSILHIFNESLEKYTYLIPDVLVPVIVEIIKTEDTKFKELFCSDMFLVHKFVSNDSAKVMLVEIARSSKTTFTVLENILKLWKNSSFIKFAPRDRQEYLFEMIIYLLQPFTKEDFLKNGSKVSSFITEGIHNRLDKSLEYVRKSGIVVGERFSQLVGEKINFGEYVGELERMEAEYCRMKDSIFKTRRVVDEKVERGTDDDVKKRKKKKKSDVIDPNQCLFDNDDDSDDDSDDMSDTEHEETEKEYEEIDHLSDVDSLESFDLDADVEEKGKIDKVTKPQYLRELIPLLTAKTDDDYVVQKIEMGLEHAHLLIREKPDDIDHIAVAVCKVLLFLNDAYNAENFTKNKMNALVALFVCSTKKTVPYVCREYYKNNLSIVQRIELLKGLKNAAFELSNRDRKDLNKKEELPPAIEEKKKKKKDEIKKKYPKNTRIWGSMKKKTDDAKPNNFTNSAELFFYPLLKDFDSPGNTIRMLEDDHYLLSELINSLSTFIFCCGDHFIGHKLALSMLEFLWILRHHRAYFQKKPKIRVQVRISEEENESRGIISVRRNVLFALFHSINALSSTLLLENQGLLSQYLDWLVYISQDDADQQCRDLSQIIIGKLKQKIAQ